MTDKTRYPLSAALEEDVFKTVGLKPAKPEERT